MKSPHRHGKRGICQELSCCDSCLQTILLYETKFFQNHVISGEVSGLSKSTPSKVKAVGVHQTLQQSICGFPPEVLLCLIYRCEEMLQGAKTATVTTRV